MNTLLHYRFVSTLLVLLHYRLLHYRLYQGTKLQQRDVSRVAGVGLSSLRHRYNSIKAADDT